METARRAGGRSAGRLDIAAAALLLAGSRPAASGTTRPLNLLIVAICSSRQEPYLPQLEGLPEDAVVFEQAMALSSWCVPERSSAAFDGAVGDRLRESGYRTRTFPLRVGSILEWTKKDSDPFLAYVSLEDPRDGRGPAVERALVRLMHSIKKAGLWATTIVILTSDPKVTPAEEFRVPLTIHHPGHPETNGKRIPGLVRRRELVHAILETLETR